LSANRKIVATNKTAGNEPKSKGFNVYTVINNTTRDKAMLKENNISNNHAGIGRIIIPSAAMTRMGVPRPVK
jgi:hypothetical protein